MSPIYKLLGQKGGGATARPRPEVALICGNLDFRLHAAVRTPAGTTGRSQHSPSNISKCRQRAEDLASERVRRRVVLDPPHDEHEVGLPIHEDDVLAVADETDASRRYRPKRLAVCSQLPIRESESRVSRVGGANASHFNRTNEAAGTTFFPNQVGKIASAIHVSSTFPTWSTRVRVRAKVVAPDDRAGLQTRGCVRPWQGVGSPNSRGTRYTPTHPRRSASR